LYFLFITILSACELNFLYDVKLCLYVVVTSPKEVEENIKVATALKDFPTAPDGFKLNEEWYSFYKNKYLKKGKIYVPVVVTEDPIKKCGCEGKCTTNSAKYNGRCGYCNKHMRSSCIHDDGMVGVCRECFMKHYDGSDSVLQMTQEDDHSKGNIIELYFQLHYLYLNFICY
jgi:hypothetical protein